MEALEHYQSRAILSGAERDSLGTFSYDISTDGTDTYTAVTSEEPPSEFWRIDGDRCSVDGDVYVYALQRETPGRANIKTGQSISLLVRFEDKDGYHLDWTVLTWSKDTLSESADDNSASQKETAGTKIDSASPLLWSSSGMAALMALFA